MDAKSTLGLTCSAGVKRAVLFQYVFACDSALTGVNVTFFFLPAYIITWKVVLVKCLVELNIFEEKITPLIVGS